MIRLAKIMNQSRVIGSLWLPILLAIVGAAGEGPVTILQKISPDRKSGEVFKNLKVLNNTPSDLLLPSMQFITSSLGVSCEYCHVENAFDKDDKKPKNTARQMMQMVNEINSKFQGKQEVTCYSCHRGTPKPLTVPSVAGVTTRLLSQPVPPVQQEPPNQPPPRDVIAKYAKARGGASAIASVASLEENGKFESDALSFAIDVYATRSGRSANVIHFPGVDRITVFNGTSGLIAVPGRPTRAMTPGEADAARLDIDLQFAPDLNKVFPEIKLTGISKVGTVAAFDLIGKRPGLPPVEMYFGLGSGLLLRTVQYSPSALGLNPTQTDYSDYRDASGVKIPFHWISATPTGRLSVQIEAVRTNVEIPEKVFSIPPAQAIP